MEHVGAQNGAAVRNNHDRDSKVANGVNGAVMKREPSPSKATKAGGLATVVNGDVDTQKAALAGSGALDQANVSNLPPEIKHITENYFPLPFILQRLAQKSHNELQLKIEELASMPLGPGAMNGNTAGTGEDSSEANQNKKANLLSFVGELHSKWVKALVISEWSRKSGQVSKLIDLHGHMLEELRKYDMLLDRMGHIKRNLYGARLPDPDLKTALQVLSSGQAPWMPDFNFIPPPPLTPKEIMKWVNELDVLLSIRLNLDDYDKIPPQFKNYSIANGRATFKVKGEFEVDLTIADDDFEKQWWLLDFRFTFSPSPQELTEKLRQFVEQKVNDLLETDGLKGCYEFLHEFVLTHKINELKRQALALSHGLWIDNISIEPLNRALSIQYWTNRLAGTGQNSASNKGSAKSWVIIGVNSGRSPAPNAPLGSPLTSYLSLRWFRDGKEVTDEKLPLDSDTISAEALLKQIIGLHVKHILSSIHAKLLSKPRYANRQASVSLDLNKEEPSESSLAVQITHSETLMLRINTVTGSFFLQPTKSIISRRENQLNLRGKDSIEDGFIEIENIRLASQFDELIRRGRGMGWLMRKRPVQMDEVKKLYPSREQYQAVWLKLEGWGPAWYVVVCLGLAGDSWWVVEITAGDDNKNRINMTSTNRAQQPNARTGNNLDQPSGRIKSFNLLPIKPNPEFSVSFFVELALVASDAIESLRDYDALRSSKIPFSFRPMQNSFISSRLKIPALYVKTAAILPDRDGQRRQTQSKLSWAREFVQIFTRGVNRDGPRIKVIREARVMVRDPNKLSLIKKGSIGNDVYYDPKVGQFRMTIQTPCDRSCLPDLVELLRDIDRLVEFATVISDPRGKVRVVDATLRSYTFTYGEPINDESNPTGRYKATLDFDKNEEKIIIEPDNPHVRVWDMLQKFLKSPSGIKQAPYCLQSTIYLYRAFEAIEISWDSVSRNDQGFVEVTTRALDWNALHFELPGSSNKAPRKLQLSIRAHNRQDVLYWHVERSNHDRGQRDEFDLALQPIFTSPATPEGWKGLEHSAVARDGSGIELLLTKISDAVKSMATGAPAPTASASAAAAPAANMGATQGAAIVLD